MKLKRGWWKLSSGWMVRLAGELDGDWCGLSGQGCIAKWPADVIELAFDNATYCGDGPEPVEPVQLCLGWWERRDGYTTKIVKNRNDGRFRWEASSGGRYDDEGMLSSSNPSKTLPSSLVKRRPDLDAKEAEQAKPDPRDAEIERLKGEVIHLTGFKQAYLALPNKTELIQNKEDRAAKYLGRHWADTMEDIIEHLTEDNAKLKNDLENIKRIIGDH